MGGHPERSDGEPHAIPEEPPQAVDPYFRFEAAEVLIPEKIYSPEKGFLCALIESAFCELNSTKKTHRYNARNWILNVRETENVPLSFRWALSQLGLLDRLPHFIRHARTIIANETQEEKLKSQGLRGGTRISQVLIRERLHGQTEPTVLRPYWRRPGRDS